MNSILIAKENIERVWPGIVQLVASAMEHSTGEYPIEYVLQELMAGRFQLWLGFDEKPELKAMAVTSIANYPAKKRLRFELLAGKDFESFYDKIDDIEQWATQFGAVETEAYVRPGFVRLLEKRGFRTPYRMVVRTIGA